MIGLITGVTLALTSRWGLLRHYWVLTKLVLLIAVIVVGMLLFDPGGLASAAETGTQPVAQQWARVSVVGSQLVMLVTATVFSVFEPRARTAFRRARAST